MTSTTDSADTDAMGAFAGRLFESVLGMIDGWSIYVGDKLGLYDALADGP